MPDSLPDSLSNSMQRPGQTEPTLYKCATGDDITRIRARKSRIDPRTYNTNCLRPDLFYAMKNQPLTYPRCCCSRRPKKKKRKDEKQRNDGALCPYITTCWRTSYMKQGNKNNRATYTLQLRPQLPRKGPQAPSGFPACPHLQAPLHRRSRHRRKTPRRPPLPGGQAWGTGSPPSWSSGRATPPRRYHCR